MKLTNILSVAAVLALAACTQAPQNKTVTVTNSSAAERTEVVAFDLASVKDFIGEKKLAIKDAQGNNVPVQITKAGEVLFLAKVAPNASADYTIVAVDSLPAFPQQTCGKVYPERVDDIAWENDRIAFRAYGPALQASGERAFGYDVWVKRAPEMVVEARYATELGAKPKIDSLKAAGNEAEATELQHATSYHYDHGNGLDCYKVGPTLGGGASALLDGENIVYPYCYKECEIVENGPLRFEVKLTYNPVQYQGKDVVETRTIRLDAGSQLNHTIVEYAGLDGEATVVAGPVVHHADGGENVADAANGFVGYADPTDRPDEGYETIYVGSVFATPMTDAKLVLFPEAEAADRGANGHVLGYAKVKPGEKFDYYWGAGWTKYGFQNFDAWKNYLSTFAANLKTPLTVAVK